MTRTKKIYLGYLDFLSEEIEHIEPDEEANLQKYLKALFAQQIYDESLYYQVINQDDIMLERVMELEREGLSHRTLALSFRPYLLRFFRN